LLGLCSQAERECVEAEYFEDEAAFQAMLTAEDDLIDAYARGELTRDERRRFETHFLTSMRGRDRVHFARAFADVVSSAPPVKTRPHAIWLNIVESLRGWHDGFRIAMVAVVIILVVAISWIFVERRRMSNEVLELRAGHAEVRKQNESSPPGANDERERNGETATQPDNLPRHSDKPRRQKSALHTQRARQVPIETVDSRLAVERPGPGVTGRLLGQESRVAREIVVLPLIKSEASPLINTQDAALGNSFERKQLTELPLNAQNVTNLLSLQPVNSGVSSVSFSLEPQNTKSKPRTTIKLASSIKAITLQLRLEVAKPHREYRAVIETADGRPVTTLSWSTSSFSNVIDTPSLLTVDLPSGDYVLFLTGKISNGSYLRVAEFSFRVVRN
jgi:hypothetical protein